jgi:DNA replication protein
MTFDGFPRPQQNYSKLPHVLIDCLPMIDSMAELKVLLYLIRHTWGFSEYAKPKRITTDEFMRGRKRKNGTRIDAGTGMANKSVISGLQSAVEHGFVLVEIDDSDLARIEKRYSLNMSGVKDLHTGQENLHSDYVKVTQRSEKETIERNSKTKEEEAAALETNVSTLKELHEQNIGMVTPLLMNMLRNAALTYPVEWFQPAFEITVKSARHRSWAFVEAVLEGWRKNGYGWKPERQVRATGKPSPSIPPADDDYSKELEARRARLRAEKANAVKVSV